MKMIIGLFLVMTVGITSGLVVNRGDSPIEVASDFFEFSRAQKTEQASRLWSLEPDVRNETLPVASDKFYRFRWDLHYASTIADTGDQIVDHREFQKGDSATVLCLSLLNTNGLRRVFRVSMIKTESGWKIFEMMNANEDVLAAVHGDCGTVSF